MLIAGKWPCLNSSPGYTSATIAVPERSRSNSAARDTGSNSSRVEIGCHYPCNLGAVALANPAERGEQPNHHVVSCGPIIDTLAVPPSLNECSAAGKLKWRDFFARVRSVSPPIRGSLPFLAHFGA